MQSPHSLTTCLALVVSLLAVPACSPAQPTFQVYPSRADLTVQPKPQPPADIVTSEAAADAYDIRLEAWGEAGWRQVARLCRWAVSNGAPDISCPKETNNGQ